MYLLVIFLYTNIFSILVNVLEQLPPHHFFSLKPPNVYKIFICDVLILKIQIYLAS